MLSSVFYLEVTIMTTDNLELDKLDLHILTLLTGQSLWKKRVYETLQEHGHAETAVSVQTVGRHINTLRDHGYLELQVLSPEDTRRNLIAAYTTTERGEAALDEYRICDGCGELVAADDHVHRLEEADAYFSAVS